MSKHARAEQLMLEALVEPLTAEQRAWLDAHLDSCAECARLGESTGTAVRALRTAAVRLPAGLAERTRMRVYLRTAGEGGRRPWRWPVWVSCGVSWAIGAASAPYVWRGFEWAGRLAGVSDAVWKACFGLWWAAPALASVAILLAERTGGRTALESEE